jgi:CheY-like chemotaxis protein/anti-sigma regulatory factor (Ser/Thr protein kinase)
LVGEVRDILRGLAASKRLRIDACVDADVEVVTVDPARVKQILYNFLSNAIKFTPEDGTIAIRITPEGTALFRIDVEDSGVGIAAEDLGKLFVEFQQLDATSAKKYQGTGLGLALTKRVAEAHGGRVVVRSTPGVGSTFSAILPRALAIEAFDDAPATQVVSPRPVPVHDEPCGRTVLVIDDDPVALKLADVALRQAGYSPVCAFSAEDGLRALKANAPALIVLDLLMPGTDGFACLARLRQGGAADVPVVVWTVKDIEADERRRLSVAAIVSKGAGDASALVDEVRTWLPRKPASDKGLVDGR